MNKEKIVIVGNPNVGKSILFNRLDHMYSMVANYPHTTVEVKRTDIKIGGRDYELVDCPGINSLYIQSEDEMVTRDVLLKENPKVIIQCLDSTNIRRSLLLTAQLLELEVPLILSLNIIDETFKKGVWIDSRKLETLLRIPVIETIATEDRGIRELFARLDSVLKNGADVRKSGPVYRKIIEGALERISNQFGSCPPSRAVMLQLLIEDSDVVELVGKNYGQQIIENIKSTVKAVKKTTAKNLCSIILDDLHEWVGEKLEDIIKTARVSTSNISEKIGWATRHPVLGWPILAGVVYLIYILVGKIAADKFTGFLEKLFYPVTGFIGSFIKSEFLRDFLVGDYGILSAGLVNALCTALPILFMFFLILNILEDSGYLSNLCILTCRFTKKLGVSGKAIMPLMLGFGCKTMATLTTKILDSKKERYIAIFLIAFAIPCSPQMGLILAILGSFSFAAFLTVFGVLVLVEFIAGVILNRILKDDVCSDFVLEIPAMRIPNIRNMFTKLYYRMKWFLEEVPPLFMAGAFLLFVLDKTGGLDLIRKALSPLIVSFLSLPIQTVEAFLLCLVKHEAGAVMLINLTEKNLLNYSQIIISLVIITSLGPCFANLMAIIRQIRIRDALFMRMIIFLSSILTGGAVNWIFRFLRRIL